MSRLIPYLVVSFILLYLAVFDNMTFAYLLQFYVFDFNNSLCFFQIRNVSDFDSKP